MGNEGAMIKERQTYINRIYKADLADNTCPHCNLRSLLREGKGWHCFQCGRDFGATGRRFVSAQREKERGCFPNGTIKRRNRGSIGVGANSGSRLGRS